MSTECDCNPNGAFQHSCNNNGECDCKEGYYGYRCDQCKPTFYFTNGSCKGRFCTILLISPLNELHKIVSGTK